MARCRKYFARDRGAPPARLADDSVRSARSGESKKIQQEADIACACMSIARHPVESICEATRAQSIRTPKYRVAAARRDHTDPDVEPIVCDRAARFTQRPGGARQGAIFTTIGAHSEQFIADSAGTRSGALCCALTQARQRQEAHDENQASPQQPIGTGPTCCHV